MWEKLEYDLAPWFDPNLWGWLIDIGAKDTDYILWADILSDLLDEKPTDYQIRFEYNQGAEFLTRNWCTVFSAFTMLSYLKNREFTLTQIKEVWNLMIKDWKLDPDVWAYLSDAIDYVRRWYNANYRDKITSYKVNLKDLELLSKIDEKNLMIQVWYRTSSELYLDSQDDWNCSKKDYPKWGWHATCRWGSVWWIQDNYEWQKKFNRYTFEFPQDLINNWVVFPDWYIFLNA